MDICEFKDQIWNYTRKISENVNNVFCPICQEQGVTLLQSRVLLELHAQELHSIGSLAGRIHAAEANVSAMCKKLENQGLLRRFRDPQDERVVNVRLTGQGADLARAIDLAINERFRCFRDEEDFKDILRGLQKLNELLEKMSRTGQ